MAASACEQPQGDQTLDDPGADSGPCRWSNRDRENLAKIMRTGFAVERLDVFAANLASPRWLTSVSSPLSKVISRPLPFHAGRLDLRDELGGSFSDLCAGPDVVPGVGSRLRLGEGLVIR